MSLPLNQPFLRSVFGHFPLLTPFLEVFAGLTLNQLLKGFPHGLLPGELPHHTKRTLFFCCLLFSIGYLHRVAGQTAALATKSGNEPLKTCKLPSDLQILLSKFS